MSDDVFSVLPGLEVPVGGIAASLARLWDGDPADGAGAPSEFRASQMNLVLHLGLPTTPDDGLAQFAAALRFTQRYPARILVLCPRAEGGADLALRAKIYSECFIGSSRREMSCIEAVMLSYPQERRDFLEDQVSIIVEADLPIYYWVHRMSQVHKIATYQWLLRNSDRFLLDTAVSTPEARTYAWPRPDGFRDLAQARLLPVRQSVGQFLSAYAPAAIARGLQAVTVAHDGDHAAEGRVLLEWARVRLEACGVPAQPGPAYRTRPVAAGTSSSLELNFGYDDGRHFLWRADFAHGGAYFESTLGGGRQMLPMTTGLLATEAALGEAIFY
ncbi:MAG: glucose-6-phosphate dehydrogenase assembly protein OpcA [Opitutaceae bacterium]